MKKINIRLRILLIIIFFLSISAAVRIVYLSIQSTDEYSILERGEFTFKRGDILDRNNKLLATSDELDSLYANPREIKSIDDTSQFLSNVLNIPKSSIVSKLKSRSNFVWIKRQLSPGQAELIRSKKISGIGLKKEYKRFYPNKDLASHILGFCNLDSKGVEGIEKSMDSYLISDVNKQNFAADQTENDGLNVALTIDANIQAFSDKTVSLFTKKFKAAAGSMILLDGKSGEILSMSNYPAFDPNSYYEYDQSSFRNYAIFNQYEPGSVMKIFSIASLLDSEKISGNDFFYCDGSYTENGVTVNCTGVHGAVNYYGIFKYSCNAGMLQAAKKISDADFYHYLKLFGFGLRTTVLLPGEQPGLFRDLKNWNFRSMMSIPLGQEISVNALQIVRASTTFFNDGIMIEPYIVRNVSDRNNRMIKTYDRKEVRRVLGEGVSQKIITAMKSSTEIGGSASKLNVDGIQFAAKSGTGEVFDTSLNQYSSKNFTSSLLVFFPLEKPKYILYIVFFNPKSKYNEVQHNVAPAWGGIIGAETINYFLASLTGYLQINPVINYEITEKEMTKKREFSKVVSLPIIMPDITGLSAGDVSDIFLPVNVKVRVSGNGRVIKQSPAAGEILDNGAEIKIELGY